MLVVPVFDSRGNVIAAIQAVNKINSIKQDGEESEGGINIHQYLTSGGRSKNKVGKWYSTTRWFLIVLRRKTNVFFSFSYALICAFKIRKYCIIRNAYEFIIKIMIICFTTIKHTIVV